MSWICARRSVRRVSPTGEEPEDFGADDGKDPAAQSLGKRGGKARAAALSKKRRSEIAKQAAAKRAAG